MGITLSRARRTIQVAEPLEARRLRSSTLFSTGFESGSTGTFTSYGYAPNENLTAQPTRPPAGTVGLASLVTPDVTASSGSATVYTYASSGITPTADNAQYVGLSDLDGITPASSAFYFPNLPSITPVAGGDPIVTVYATIGVLHGLDDAAFGLSALDGAASPNQHVVADLQVDATTGAVTVNEGARATGFAQPVSTGVTFASYELQLDYATQTYSAYEGTSAASLAPIAVNVPFEAAATTFSTAALDTQSLAAAGRSSGYALFDNLSITTDGGGQPTRLAGTTYGTVGSYGNLGNTIAKATDGSPSTFFDAPMATGGNVGIDLGAAETVTQIDYAPRAGWASRMVGGQFQVSTSMTFSSGVTTVYTVAETPTVGQLTTVAVSLPTAYRYWRYIGPANGYCNIAEFQLFGPAGTPASARLGGTTYGTVGSYGNVAADTIAAATDGNLSTFLDAPTASGGNVGLDLGSAKTVTAIEFAPRSGFASRMVGGMFQVSTSMTFSSNVTTVYTITSAPATGSLTTVGVSLGSAYRYWRYIGPTNGYCNIAEFELFGY